MVVSEKHPEPSILPRKRQANTSFIIAQILHQIKMKMFDFNHIGLRILWIRKYGFVFELCHGIMNTSCIINHKVTSEMASSGADRLRAKGPAFGLVHECRK
jgi:hypothetical protein